ncbi:UNVERIFIED_CONTAM: Extracellular serine proteinase [Trichonephila clavipes]
MPPFRQLALALALLGGAHAHAAIDQYVPVAERGVIANQYIVQLDLALLRQLNGALPVGELVNGLLARVPGTELLHVYSRALPGLSLRMTPAQARLLSLLPGIVRVEQDSWVQVAGRTTVNAASYYGLDRIDQPAGLNGLYSYPSLAGQGVHVYVLDTGLRASHTEFTGRVGSGRNFAPNSGGLLGLGASTNAADTSDCNGHGTHVAGTIAGRLSGVARQAIVHPVRVMNCNGSGSTSNLIAGIDWLIANAQRPAVANLSLGGSASTALDNAVRNAVGQGITMVVAAGNNNANACNESPARASEALVVGATGSSDRRSSYSNYGTCLDIFAPGDNILSAGHNSDTGTATLSGTSMAAPHVAGAAALYLASRPQAAPAAVAAGLISLAGVDLVTDPRGSSNRLLNVGALEDTGDVITQPPVVTPPVTPPVTPEPTVPCTGCTAYSVSFTNQARTVYAPGSIGFSFTGGTLRGYVRGASGGSVGITLERRVDLLLFSSWQTVALTSTANGGNLDAASGNLASGTYRWRLNVGAGSGSATFYGQPR